MKSPQLQNVMVLLRPTWALVAQGILGFCGRTKLSGGLKINPPFILSICSEIYSEFI